MRLDDAVAFGVESHGADGRPVASLAGPARWVSFTGLGVQRMSGGQNRVIVACVSLGRADVANAAVAMLEVVPTHKAGRPGTGRVKISEALGGELGPVLGRAKQRLGIGVVVADTRPRVRGLDAQPVEHRQHRRGLERGAIVAMQHRLGLQGGNALG